jgi:hypothetical protein
MHSLVWHVSVHQIFDYMTWQAATGETSPMTKTPEVEGQELDPSIQDQMDEEMAPATPGTMHDKDYTSTDSQRGSLSSTKEKNETTDG